VLKDVWISLLCRLNLPSNEITREMGKVQKSEEARETLFIRIFVFKQSSKIWLTRWRRKRILSCSRIWRDHSCIVIYFWVTAEISFADKIIKIHFIVVAFPSKPWNSVDKSFCLVSPTRCLHDENRKNPRNWRMSWNYKQIKLFFIRPKWSVNKFPITFHSINILKGAPTLQHH
jgi:hypothetical protein